MKIPGKLPINTIYKQFPQLNQQQLDSLSNAVNIAPQNVVSVDTKKIINQRNRKTFSVRLKRWVEPYKIGGINYSLFYTEVNHNYQKGDRVFIEGGAYDSDDLVLSNRYGRGVDGYKVLFVDRCKIVLDIKYTGVMPTNEEDIDNFTKIYVVKTQAEFEYYLQTLSMRDDSGQAENKFEVGYNNFLYLDGVFSIPVTGFFNGIQSFQNEDGITNPFTQGNGFFVKNGSRIREITSDVTNNNYTSWLNTSYQSTTSGFYNNGKLRIMNNYFQVGLTKFKNGRYYKYVTDDSKWIEDKSYLPVVITEQHFRGGNFARGEFNQGLFGHYEKELTWNAGNNVTWNLGSLLNTRWQSGVIDSTIFQQESHFTTFDRNGLPSIRANSENNGGNGYNYIFDVDFIGGDVIKGNIFNLAVLYGTNSVTSTLDNYYTGASTTYSINLSGGVYYDSDILFASISNCTLINSYVLNSNMSGVKSVNSQIEASVFTDGSYLSDKVVKIQAYEESNIVWYDKNDDGINYKMYKFYVTEDNFRRLNDFQNFYFQDLKINIPSTELLHFFDDKFTVASYTQSYDGSTSKLERGVFAQLSTKAENRNSPGVISGTATGLQPNFDILPSLDLFIIDGQDFNYATGSLYPRDFIGDTIDIANAYIIESDFVSGLFKDSTWVSGNHIDYNIDYSFSQSGSFLSPGTTRYSRASLTSANREISIEVPMSRRPDILGTSSDVSQIGFVNALYYDTTLSTGANIVKMPDVYRITDVTSSPGGRSFVLQDIQTQSVISNCPDFNSNPSNFNTPWAMNKFNYIHPVKFENSTIKSGIFRRAYFDGCTFENDVLDFTDKDIKDFDNKRQLLVSDAILDNNNNTINNGFFQYSHRTSGNDTWNAGIFHRGVWYGQQFTYSVTGATTSDFLQRGIAAFNGGVFRKSKWTEGEFNGGVFYKNASGDLSGLSAVLGTVSTYYSYNDYNTEIWDRGVFNGGDFEKSRFASGVFNSGNFYDSDMLSAQVNGGNIGRKNIPYQRSRIWSATVSNTTVVNGYLKSENATGLPSFSLYEKGIIWENGVFNAGEFGASASYPSIWKDGIFNGGEFKDHSLWENGTFNGGKFLSTRGYKFADPQTPFDMQFATGSSYSWWNGKFNGGEFGNGLTGANSLWMGGEFNGGLFKGRYWNDGVFTRGKFEGHTSTASGFTTDIFSNTYSIVNHNAFILAYNNDYYGYWNNGFVSENKDKFIKNEKIYTELERESTRKKKRKEVEFINVYWNGGTFSHTDAKMTNSIWRDGTFENGLLYRSAFNPYINLATPVFTSGTTSSPYWAVSGISQTPEGYYYKDPSISFANMSQINAVQEGNLYTIQMEVHGSDIGDVYTPDGLNILAPSGQTGIFSGTFSPSSDTLGFFFSGFGGFTFSNIIVFPGTQSGFNVSDTCVWKNGTSEESDFYYSVWEQGRFRTLSTSPQGNAWGMIWEDGICDYMNAYNVFWCDGIWRNGNWNGSPFTQYATASGQQFVYPGFSEDLMNHISWYGNQNGWEDYELVHMNDTFSASFSPVLDDPELLLGFGAGGSVWQSGTNWNTGVFGALIFFFLGYDGNTVETSTFNDPIYATNSNGFDVLANQGTYTIEIDYMVYENFSGAPSSPVTIDFELNIGDTNFGGTSEIISTTTDTPTTFLLNNYHMKLPQTITRTVTTTANLTGQGATVNIRKTSSGSNRYLTIGRLEINQVDANYDPMTNNQLWAPPTWQSVLGATISLPNTQYQVGNVNTRFGNGMYKAGIWENGVWNEGWRADKTTIWASDLSTFTGNKNFAYRSDQWSWTIKLDIIGSTQSGVDQSPGSLSDYSVGDRVGVGNVVTIDINGNRRLVLSPMTIIEIGTSTMTLNFNINFPVRRVERDSDEHPIYVTRNVWLNGVFLNGHFLDGVWNNGLMQGFPYITNMGQQQWIEGKFKGGRFRGLTSSYIDTSDNNTEVEYHTALVQKFEFSDENVSGRPFSFKYNSWMDVNYFQTSGVNINKVNQKYASTPLLFTASFIENNFYGYPTKDVLESISTIRNGFDLNSRSYKLGWKYKEYTDWIPINKNIDQFSEINQLDYLNTGTEIVETINPNSFPSGYGLESLNSGGWSFSYGTLVGAGFGLAYNRIRTNHGDININEERRLLFRGGRFGPLTGNPDDIGNFTLDIVDNTNVDIEPLRYCFAEIDVEHLDYQGQGIGNESNPITFYNNYPATYSIAGKKIIFSNNTVTIPVNQINQPVVTDQREYFFNKKGLEMTFLSGGTASIGNRATFSLAFEEIKLVETDMIPFFQMASDCVILQTAYQWDQALLDWDQALIGAGMTEIDGYGDPYWNNFYLSTGSFSCPSYVNQDVQVPNSAIAPDIDYDDANFNYISSVNILINEENSVVDISTEPVINTGGVIISFPVLASS